MAVSTIRTYVSAISFTHKFLAPCHDPTTSQWVVSLLKGFSKVRAQCPTPRPPITKVVLYRLLAAIPSVVASPYLQILVRCLFLFAFHTAARGGELVVSASDKHTLQFKDISFSCHGISSAVVTFSTFKHSKQPATFAIAPQPGSVFCPVKGLVEYIRFRGNSPGPLFRHCNGSPISLRTYQKILADVSIAAGFAPFTTHSFRIGRATELFHSNHSPEQIKRIGRWNSAAYRQYIRNGVITLPH